MYKASKFRIRPLEEIEGIIERGAEALPFIRRIFLLTAMRWYCRPIP